MPHTELVSDSEDDTEVVEVKAGKKQRREEEAKVERRRQKEVHSDILIHGRVANRGFDPGAKSRRSMESGGGLKGRRGPKS